MTFGFFDSLSISSENKLGLGPSHIKKIFESDFCFRLCFSMYKTK
jgi:hypothetical protein